MSVNVIEGQLCRGVGRFAIVVCRFNEFIVESLLKGAVDMLKRHQVEEDQIMIVRVPGAYEASLIAKKLAKKDEIDAVITLGAVIRGATAHFEYVSGPMASGLHQVMLDSEKPVIFGILTTDTIEQAVERAGTKAGNKGAEAALTAIEMLDIIQQVEKQL